MDKRYVIVRSDRAGVFAGTLESRTGTDVVMTGVRRLWYWDGAATLSQLATEGTKSPSKCKFPCEVARQEIFGVIEVIECTAQARLSIAGVPIWSA